MAKAQRDRGRRGQTQAEAVLKDRDWVTDPISAGVKREDMIGRDPSGTVWSVEVKNCMAITVAHRKQAMDQAKARGLPWMLMSKIHGTRWWLVQRKGMSPVLWCDKGMEYLL